LEIETSSSEDEDDIQLRLEFDPCRWVEVKLRRAKPIDFSLLPDRASGFKPTGEVATPRMLLLLGEIRRREQRRKQLVDARKVVNNESAIVIMQEFLAIAIRQVVSPKYARCEFRIVHPNGEPIIVARGRLTR